MRRGRLLPAAEVARRPAEVVESAVDTYDNAAVRIDLVESRCRYEGETIAGRFRVCQTWVTVEGTPRLASVQYTSSAPS